MKKWILFILVFGALFASEGKVWNPVQYRLEWNTIAGAKYRLFHAGQGMNDSYFTTNEFGEYTVEVPITNRDFSPWFSSPDTYTNVINVLQGKSSAGVKYFVVAVTNDTMFKTSNIIGWPSNWNTLSTNAFELKLVRVPLGPPMYYIRPAPPMEIEVYQ